jgi:putative component of toxin-antitoxin plasmid stabilization module
MTYIVQQTPTFAQWHAALRDLRARIAIARRIDRASAGNLARMFHKNGSLLKL